MVTLSLFFLFGNLISTNNTMLNKNASSSSDSDTTPFFENVVAEATYIKIMVVI